MKSIVASTIMSVVICSAANAADTVYFKELQAIAMNESSGGLNMNHVRMKSGMHKGDRAGGAFGLMPKTAIEIISKNEQLNKKYSFVLTMDHDQISDKLAKDYQMSFDIANAHWKHLRKHMGPKRAAYAWYNGAAAAAGAEVQTIESDEYVQKFLSVLYRKLVAYGNTKKSK